MIQVILILSKWIVPVSFSLIFINILSVGKVVLLQTNSGKRYVIMSECSFPHKFYYM